MENFIIEKKIGEGTYSKVYKGKLNDKTIVIKLLKNDYIDFMDNFRYELDLFKKIDNKNDYIINFYGYHQQNNYFYMFFEYFNSDLSNYILNDNNWRRSILFENKIIPKIESPFYHEKEGFYFSYVMNEDEKIYITKELLKSIQSLHSINIIHGDIKTENIVYMDKRLKIIDFNTATLVEKSEIDINSNYGTIGYMAPEQYEKKLSFKSDIYSLCVIIIELWCGNIWDSSNTFKGCRNELLKSLRKLDLSYDNLSKILRKNISLKREKRDNILSLWNKIEKLFSLR